MREATRGMKVRLSTEWSVWLCRETPVRNEPVAAGCFQANVRKWLGTGRG